jgi:hypothetical protein
MTIILDGTTGITTPAINSSGDLELPGGTANGVLYLNGSNVATSGSALVFDGTNLGVGVTPSAWAGGRIAIQLDGGAFLQGRTGGTLQTVLGNNYYHDGTGFKYIATGSASAIDLSAGGCAWYIAGSGSAGASVSLTQPMTLTAAGNLGIGTTSPGNFSDISFGDSILDVKGVIQVRGDATNNVAVLQFGGDTYRKASLFTPVGTDTPYLAFAIADSGSASVATERARLDASGNLGVGTTSPEAILHVAKASSGGLGAQFVLDNTAGSALNNAVEISFLTDGGASATGTRNARIRAVNQSAGDGAANLQFWTWNGAADAERARITSGGILLVGKTAADNTTGGATINSTGEIGVTITNAGGASQCIFLNREDADGDLILFRQANSTEGSISVSGSTVSYNAFAGSHWSQLQDGSKPDILRGTVMESINELCEWPGEENERLPKCKISDTAGSKKVYGVFMAWDDNWTTTNDMYVTAVGAFICRVNADVAVQEGDLLESNGDGTARVQADDIIRSSTIGKVTSTVKTHEYDDGSYCVPTVLYCG